MKKYLEFRMGQPVLNTDWLNQLFDSLCTAKINIRSTAIDLQGKIRKTLENKLNSEQWELSEFLILALAFNSMDELCNTISTVGSIYKDEWARGIGITRPLTAGDVKDIRDRCLHYYSEKMVFLKQEGLFRGISSTTTPIKWLELAESVKPHLYLQRYITTYELTNENPSIAIEVKKRSGISELINTEMATVIRYKAFSLSQQEENASHDFPYVYTLTELANRWKTNMQNVMMACGKSSHFWPYLNVSAGMKLCERKIPITMEMINENLRNGNLQADYKYGLRGYVRLAKKIDLPHKITLEYFYANKIIDPKNIRDKKTYTPFIWLEPPFCKYVLGIYQFIEVTHPIEPTLFFLGDEIYDFEKTDEFKKLFSPEKNTKISHAIDGLPLCDEKNISFIEQKNSSAINKFRKNGGCYEIDYVGQKFILKSSKGLEYIEYLLKNASKEIRVRDLERAINKSTFSDEEISLAEAAEAGLNDANDILPDDMADEKAIKTVNIKLKEKEEDLQIAKKENQIELAEEIEEEIGLLKKYLNGALGKNYKPRKIPDENEKARKRVLDAITNARNAIKSYNQSLFDHLLQSIKTGYFCNYEPVPAIKWL
ncbi:MAG TPA: hypothetical protein VLJ15_08215 [Gammaproteobacteria bacterium]|nr:hypothetical protein [Gammaproteobacteria bacterium]